MQRRHGVMVFRLPLRFWKDFLPSSSPSRHSRAGGNLVSDCTSDCFFKNDRIPTKIPACAEMTSLVWLSSFLKAFRLLSVFQTATADSPDKTRRQPENRAKRFSGCLLPLALGAALLRRGFFQAAVEFLRGGERGVAVGGEHGEMPHFAAGAGGGFAVQVQLRLRMLENR